MPRANCPVAFVAVIADGERFNIADAGHNVCVMTMEIQKR
jgi:hypothetical protein